MRDVLKNGAARFLLGIMVKHQSHYMRHTKPFWATDCYRIKVDALVGFQVFFITHKSVLYATVVLRCGWGFDGPQWFYYIILSELESKTKS